jgi:hypothetical protein
MKVLSCVLCFAVILIGFSGLASAQSVISAKAGLINYTEGMVLLQGKEVRPLSGGLYPQMATGQELKTGDSRAEMLLSPGVFLRVGENSDVKMLSDKVEDTRLQLTSGSIIVECGALQKGDIVTVVHKNAVITLAKDGLYRLDSEPAQLRVYEGEAQVEQAGQTASVKKGRLLPLNGLMVTEKFDPKTTDALFRWARHRAEYVAMANPSAARGLSYGGQLVNSWVYNPYFGMYTFVPGGGFYNSVWGYRYWSPSSVWAVYNPPVYNNGGGNMDSGFARASSTSGYSGVSMTSAGTSGTAAVSASPSTSSGSSSTAVGHSSGSAGGTHR